MSDRSRAAHALKPRIPRTARADKAAETERRLMDAAAKVVGADGYANASVARITALADVAQGTFYNYFASQQDLFDHLLPELGGELLEFIRARVAGIDDSLTREEAGFLAFFEFLEARPEFYRILNEAETFSPKAFHAHMRNMAEGYLRALRRSHAKGELPGFDRRELEVIVYTLLAARNYIAYRYATHEGEGRPSSLPPWVVEAYMKLVTGGMRFGGTARRTGRSRRAASSPLEPGAPRIEVRRQEPGRAEVEMHAGLDNLDAAGCVPATLFVSLIERASAAVLEARLSEELRLESLSTSFIRPARALWLLARARSYAGERAHHVDVEIADKRRPDVALVLARAVYAQKGFGS